MSKMKVILLWFFVAINFNPAFSQNKIRGIVKDNVNIINNLDNDKVNYSDLKTIGNAIGNAKVVMLGEQGHGDGTTFSVKSNIVKYLHEKKDFDVLIFESDFFSLNEGFKSIIKDSLNVSSFLRGNTYPVWNKCGQCKDLFYNYIPKTYKTKNPLLISGIDNQFHGSFSRLELRNYIYEQMALNSTGFTKTSECKYVFAPLVDTIMSVWDRSRLVQSFVRDKANDIKRMKMILEKILKDDNLTRNSFYTQVFKNLYSFCDELENYNAGRISDNVRDVQMADNLSWVVNNLYSDKKVIVWAANEHLRTIGKYKFIDKGIERVTMGQEFTKIDSNRIKTYLVGFTSHKGKYKLATGRSGLYIRSKRNGFDNWFKKKVDYAFVDFNKVNPTIPNNGEHFLMKGRGHKYDEADWNNIFNGVLYIKKMKGCM